MPKLASDAIDRRKRRVEDGALRLFRARGYHGVGLREIADEAGVSLGNVYNYYAGKEELFQSLLARLHAAFSAPDTPLGRYLATCRLPDDIDRLGAVVGQMVAAHADYLTLIYVDTAEFQGRHVRAFYAGLAARFRAALGPRAGQTVDGVDPVLVFTAAYMQFFNYFIVERMIGARGHLGLSDRQAVAALGAIFRRGLPAPQRGPKRAPARARRRS